MRPSLTIPYMSLNDLYRREHTVKFIWYGSQLHAKAFGLDEDFSSKKFYKHYFRKLKPSPFIVQIINSIIPVAIIECVNGNLKNAEVNMIEGKIQSVDCPPPVPFKPKPGVTLVPANCN